MISLPEAGVRLSAREHNSDLGVVCDWIEASVLLTDATLSAVDVIDVLIEEEVYRDQDFAREFIEQAWAAIGRRQGWLGTSGILTVRGDRLVRLLEWNQAPAHAFCLLVALRRSLKAWSRALGPDYTEQGRLFEEITAEALSTQGWAVFRTGWAGINTPPAFVEVVTKVANQLNDLATVGADVPQEVKDQGLDLVCYMPFKDRRGGYPLFLVQCASGDGWRGKLRSPSLELWRDLIRFSAPYPRAIAVPFAFLEDDLFRSTRLSADGLFLDRFRILSAGFEAVGWESDQLRQGIVGWLEPKILTLPTYTQG